MNKSIWMALGAMLAVGLWLYSGSFVDRPTEESASADSSSLMRVAVQTSKAEWVAQDLIVQGLLEAYRKVSLSAETPGQVYQLLVDKGARVTPGQVLVKLRSKDKPAQIAQASAEIENQLLRVKAMQQLNKQGLQAQTELKEAQAALAAARAEQQRWQFDLADTEIKAPFAGIVETREVELGSYVEVGNPIIGLIDISRLKAVAKVTQQDRPLLHLGQSVSVRLLDGRHKQARLTFVARDADPATRSFRVEAEFDNPDAVIAAGPSAELGIDLGKIQAHFLSPASLMLDDQGRLGVMTVDEANRAAFYPVERVKASSSGIWVSGLPERVRIITRGQGFVVAGETVDPVVQESTERL